MTGTSWCVYPGFVSVKLFQKRRHGRHNHCPMPSSDAAWSHVDDPKLYPLKSLVSQLNQLEVEASLATPERRAKAAQDLGLQCGGPGRLSARNASPGGWEVSFLRCLHKEKSHFLKNLPPPYSMFLYAKQCTVNAL